MFRDDQIERKSAHIARIMFADHVTGSPASGPSIERLVSPSSLATNSSILATAVLEDGRDAQSMHSQPLSQPGTRVRARE